MEKLGWDKHDLWERPAFIGGVYHRTAHFLQQHELNINKFAAVDPLLDEDHKCGLPNKELVDICFGSFCGQERWAFERDKNRFWGVLSFLCLWWSWAVSLHYLLLSLLFHSGYSVVYPNCRVMQLNWVWEQELQFGVRLYCFQCL